MVQLKIDKQTVMGAVVVVIIIAIIYGFFSNAWAAQAPINLPLDYNSEGSANSPVVIEEFSDFECPACSYFYENAYPQIMESYVKTGKVRVVFKPFPLTSLHKNSEKAAEAALCAAEQGKFWEMHDKLFENQDALGVANLKSYAASLGLDQNAFNQCLDSGKMRPIIENNIAEGKARGISATPSFFVNGKKIVGAQPFETFQQAIDGELAKNAR
jgi:protein-disulfide isomerase